MRKLMAILFLTVLAAAVPVANAGAYITTTHPSNPGVIRGFDPQPDPPAFGIFSPGAKVSLNPQPLPPGGDVSVSPQPIPPGTIRGFNPQPDPPRVISQFGDGSV